MNWKRSIRCTPRTSSRGDGWSTSAPDDLAVLRQELQKALDILDGIDSFYEDFLATDLPALGQKQSSAIVIAQILDNFYTCLETTFLRISRFFENSLDPARWHDDLLEKMSLAIAGVRERVVSEDAYPLLWDKLRFLQSKYTQLRPIVRRDLKRFIAFLGSLRG